MFDVTGNEGARRVRAGRAAQHLAAVRHRALNLLRRDRTRRDSLDTRRFRAALNQDYLATLLAGAPAPAADRTT